MNSKDLIKNYPDQLNRQEWKIKRQEILSRDKNTCQKCHKSSVVGRVIVSGLILHVHHRYYQFGLLAWQYPDECYITLCESCHTYFHDNRNTPIKDESGNIVSHAKVCNRCGGGGRMPEYDHVQRGVCFRCKV